MTPEMIALARRLVACKHWPKQWVPGARGRANGGRGYTIRIGDQASESDYPLVYIADGDNLSDCDGLEAWLEHDALPDLTDPATLGCLLALVRKALDCPEAHVYYAPNTDLWVVRWGHAGRGILTVDAATEAKALVAALEAAP